MGVNTITGSERYLLKVFWEVFDDLCRGKTRNPCIAGWNILGFDIPFLIKRSWMLRVPLPNGVRRGRYLSDKFVDLMEVWCEYKRNEYASLKNVAKYLGVSQPRRHHIQGKDFYKHLENDRENALQYLEDDLQESMDIAKIILDV